MLCCDIQIYIYLFLGRKVLHFLSASTDGMPQTQARSDTTWHSQALLRLMNWKGIHWRWWDKDKHWGIKSAPLSKKDLRGSCNSVGLHWWSPVAWWKICHHDTICMVTRATPLPPLNFPLEEAHCLLLAWRNMQAANSWLVRWIVMDWKWSPQ